MDVVVQAKELPAAAVEAFGVTLPAVRIQRRTNCARLFGVRDDAESRGVALALAGFWNCDTAFIPRPMHYSDYRVLVLDMDSTVLTIECIDELARLAGKGTQVAAITEAAMRGEIADYAESLRRRVALLAGTEESVLDRVRTQRLQLSAGARDLIGAARAIGWKTLLVSGGFSVFADVVRQDLGIDASCANRLVTRGGRLTGEVRGAPEDDGRIVDAAGKARALQRLCDDLPCAAEQAIAIGDGANDLEMMALAGLSVAFRAKPVVRQRAAVALDHTGLDGVLNLFSDAW